MKKLLLFFLLLGISNFAQIITSNTFDTNLGWTIAHPTGTSTNAGWSRVTSGTYPSCVPKSGAGMARFNSYNIAAGNVYSLTSSALTFSGNNCRVNFYMYRDGEYATDADKIDVYFKTSVSDPGILLGTVNRSTALSPQVSANGWYFNTFDLPQGVVGTGYISFYATSQYGNNIFIDQVVVETIPAYDGFLTSLSVPNFNLANQNIPIQGTFKNNGMSVVNSFDVSWQVNGGVVHNQAISGLNLDYGQEYFFTHQDFLNDVAGLYNLNVTISNINGDSSLDTNTTNDVLVKDIMIYNELYPRKVVYEEGTGTWCGWCVRGHVGLKDMEHYHEDGSWIGIAVHNGDPMVLSAYDTGLGIGSFPSGKINRSSVTVDPESSGLEVAYQDEIQKISEGKIHVSNQSWNDATRQISIDLTATFALDINNANYKMGVIVVENGVTGTDSGYNQTNYYSYYGYDIFDYEGINWKDLGNPIPAANMIYNHVGRALIGGYTGQSGSVPTTIVYNTPYNYTFNYTLPTLYNANNIKLVAVLLNSSGKIINAEEVDLNTTMSIDDLNALEFSIFPNPSKDFINVVNEKPMNIEIYNTIGELVFKQNNVLNNVLNISDLNAGFYFVKATNGSQTGTKKIVKY